ncbi:hypothetical protein Aglo03_47660 [Actinokineospora globicatena]|uniref:Uncharacterized protein n=1 Tax=Actinokineospora globicatena TaxID=103729 RepID=A0A9W6V8H1_9PSEU|nr:hypothetical protein Aglo03_47660 [Actinokineospora globicatena]
MTLPGVAPKLGTPPLRHTFERSPLTPPGATPKPGPAPTLSGGRPWASLPGPPDSGSWEHPRGDPHVDNFCRPEEGNSGWLKEQIAWSGAKGAGARRRRE